MNIEHPKEEECYRIGSLHEVKVQWDVADVIKIIIVLRMSSILLGLIGQGRQKIQKKSWHLRILASLKTTKPRRLTHTIEGKSPFSSISFSNLMNFHQGMFAQKEKIKYMPNINEKSSF
jgi:hypothetical protein